MSRKTTSRRRTAVAAAFLATMCSGAGAAGAASTSQTSATPRPILLATQPQRHQLDVCSLHYKTDRKQALASMELSYRAGKCVVMARTVGSACDPSELDSAALLGPFPCEAPVTLGAVSARLAADAARVRATTATTSSSSALSGPGLNAWLTVSPEPAAAVNAWLTVSPAPVAPAARAATAAVGSSNSNTTSAPVAAPTTPQPACMLTLQEPTKLLRAPGGTLGSGGRAPYVRGAFSITGLGCRAGLDASRASVDAAADAALGGPAEQRRPFTFGLWVAPHDTERKACRLIVSATAPAAERAKAAARSAVAGDAFLSSEALACDHAAQMPESGPFAEGCCYAGRR